MTRGALAQEKSKPHEEKLGHSNVFLFFKTASVSHYFDMFGEDSAEIHFTIAVVCWLKKEFTCPRVGSRSRFKPTTCPLTFEFQHEYEQGLANHLERKHTSPHSEQCLFRRYFTSKIFIKLFIIENRIKKQIRFRTECIHCEIEHS